MAACVASPLVAASPSSGEAGQCHVQCFMSWSQPNSPHSHKHRSEERDSGHAVATARPQEACTAYEMAHTHTHLGLKF